MLFSEIIYIQKSVRDKNPLLYKTSLRIVDNVKVIDEIQLPSP